jgi:hypothetical protein
LLVAEDFDSSGQVAEMCVRSGSSSMRLREDYGAETVSDSWVASPPAVGVEA